MANAINLLVLTHNYPRRAGDHAGVFIALLAKHLEPHGLRPIVLAPHDPGAAEREDLEGVRVHRFRYAARDQDEDVAYRGHMQHIVLGSVSGVFRFRRFLHCWRAAAFDLLVRERIDAVAGHWLVPSGFVLKTIADRTTLPLVLSSHGTDVRLIRKFAGAAYRYFRPLGRRLDRWTFVSTFLRDAIAGLDPGLAPILEVLPLPHDETVFHRDPAVPREPHTIVAVTRFTPQKRVDALVKAFALVAAHRPDTRLEIYGAGPGEHGIRALIDRFGLGERVRISPPIPQDRLRTVYNRAGMVVLNSHEEGFGLALSEAMLCGAPVIGAASGGITDIIAHERRGLLVEPDNTAALAEAILRLLADHPLRARL
ncbi:MAG TPA: glycosyltransferase, partial [candidate division Zixibacteria bacterium]|nr:glycosyltransferase [candidate division Zixibacteria bacterium]